jgi:protein gp37
VGKATAIEWTDSTWNPWWGCQRVSPACAHCYADAEARRRGQKVWDNGQFRFLSDDNWRKPIRWNTEAKLAGKPRFVFCASMADVFQDERVLDEPRERLWELIDQTPWLVWLLLTKRPEMIPTLAPWTDGAPSNVWLGTSVENARHTWRARELIETPAVVHFLSCEPLLGSLLEARYGKRMLPLPDRGEYSQRRTVDRAPLDLIHIEWVIAGGESGPRFRPMNLDHVRELRDACREARVPFFLKQIGGRFPKAGGKAIDGRDWCERPIPATPSRSLSLF